MAKLMTKTIQRHLKPCIFSSLRFSKRSYSDQIPLTAVKYPHVTRSDYSKLDEKDLHYFQTFLSSPQQIITDEYDLRPHNVDWLNSYRGASQLMLKPKTTKEVSLILKYCNEQGLAVCPQGGNTGLVGGSVPVFDEIIVNMSLMNEIKQFDELTGILVCEAGCILENLQNFVEEKSYIMPLDLGAKGSCQIGGNVATNAGGLRFVRYGSLRGNVLGLEAVLPDGSIFDCMSTMRKDNTGYDMKQLLIGSEGTLGIITQVSMLCPPKPNSVAVVLLGCQSFENVLETYKTARFQLGETLSSLEFMDHECVKLVERKLNLKPPLAQHPFYVLIEVAGACAQHDEDKLHKFLEKTTTQGFVKDGVVATQPRQIQNLWSIREKIGESLLLSGYLYKYDISIPLRKFYDMVTLIADSLRGSSATICCGFGHLGDSNLHLNAVSPTYDPKVVEIIETLLTKEIYKLKGSVSAEHGVGFMKRKEMRRAKTEQVLSVMNETKLIFDPKGILNPYKVLPSD